MEDPGSLPQSPKWDATTKLVIGLTLVAMFAAMLIYFRNIIGPLILAFILAFLLHPLAAWGSKTTRISWRVSVNVIYLILVIILVLLFTLTGLAIFQQTESLVNFVDNFFAELPERVQNLSTQVFLIGPFVFDFSQLDLEALARQLLDTLQPLLGQAGTLVSKLAASAATTIAWGLFVLLISYFLLSESGQIRENLVTIEIPGYNEDIQRLAHELANTWDSFLRGQLIISVLVIFSYYLLLSILGTRLALAIALMAGIARFVPYLGPFLTWTVTAIVAFLQATNYFGLEPFQYAILVISLCIILDQVFDNLVVPRFLGQTLGIHPAGVLIAAIIATNLIGIVGLILAAPVLATLVLLGRYVSRKMFDMAPWPEEAYQPKEMALPWTRPGNWLRTFWQSLRKRITKKD